MASLLSWLGNTAKDIERNIGNFVGGVVKGAENVAGGAARGVQRNIVNPVVREVQQAPRQIANQAVRTLPGIREVNDITNNLSNVYNNLPKIQQQQVNQKLQQFSNTIKPVSDFAEGSNQTFLAGGGRELTNLAGLAAKINPATLAVDAVTHGGASKEIDKLTANTKKTFFPEAGTKNSLSPTKLEDYNATQKAGRIAGSAQKVLGEQAALMLASAGVGNAASAAAKGLPLGEGIISQVVPRVASGTASGATFGGLQAGLEGKSPEEALKQAAGWGVTGGIGGAVAPLIPNVGNIPFVRAIPRALGSATAGAFTAPLSGMSPAEGALFGLLGGSEKPYITSNVRTRESVATTLRKANGQFNGSTKGTPKPPTNLLKKAQALVEPPKVTAARQGLEDLTIQRESLLARGLTENHPAVRANEQAYQDLSRQLQAFKQGGYIGLSNKNDKILYHFTSPENASLIEKGGFDINKSSDGSIWFTDANKQNGTTSSGIGGVVKRSIKQGKLKLAGYNELDRYEPSQLAQMGYDGVKLPGGKGEPTFYQIFNPEKLTKVVDTQSKRSWIPDEGGYIGLPKKSGFAGSVAKSKETSQELQALVKNKDITYTPVTNEQQLAASEALIKKGYKKAATQINERLDTKLGTVNDQTVSDTIAAIKALDSKGGDANHALATDLTEKLAAHLTKQGQSIQAASLLNNRTPEGMLYGARKVLNKAGVEITPEMNKQFKSMTDAIGKLSGEDKQYAMAELTKEVGKYLPSSFKDKAVSLWKAGLLTGIKTQTGNALSNVTSIGLKTASNPSAAAIDKLISLVTGERTKTFTLKGDLSGAAEGVGKGIRSLRTGIDERDLTHLKFDTKQVNFGKSAAGRAAQKYVDTVFGLMSAADKPYYYSQLRNNLQDMAKAAAVNAGAKGSAREAFIQEFIKNPPQEAFQTATKAAEKSVFANDTLLSKSAAGLRNSLKDHKIASAVADVIMPFTKVPSAVITRLFDYTPVGAVKTVVQQIGKGNFDQRALAEGLAEAGTGTGVIAIGYALAHGGLMTGAYPTDQKEQELWKLEGKQPNSIKIGGKWQSVNYTSPVGQVLALGQQIADAQRQGSNALESVGAAGAGAAQAVLGQSFLQGVQGALDAASDPQRNAARVARQQAGSVVPTLIGDIAKAIDPLQRQTNNALQAPISRIPFLNQTLLPKQDAFGDPLKRQSGSINTLINPFRPSDVKEANPLNSELRRLQDAGAGVMPDTNNKTLTFGTGKDKQTIRLTPQELFDKNSKVGSQVRDIWNGIISDPAYQNLDDTGKQAALKRALTDINTASGREIASKNNVPLKSSAKGNVSAYLQGDKPSAGSYLNGSSSKAATPKDRYQQALDSYNQDKKDGKISDVADLKRQSQLTRLKAQSNFSQDAVDLYAQSFKNIVSFVNSNKNGKKLWDEVQQLDKAMTDAGYTSKLYNKNGSLKATVSGKSGGRKSAKGKVVKIANFNIKGNSKYSVKIPKAGSLGTSVGKLPVSKLPKIKINKLTA